MPYRSLLVLIADTARDTPRIDTAIALAERLGSHLVGLAAAGTEPWPVGMGASLLGIEDKAPERQRHRQQAHARAAEFSERCRQAGLPSHEVVVDDGDAAAAAVRLGHCCDLVILGQADADLPAYGDARALVEDIVLDNARPTLVLPPNERFEGLGRTVLLAWDDGREAARAAADAMPLLRTAGTVHLVHCRTPWNDVVVDPPGPTLDAVRQWLAWHGVDAQPREAITDADVGTALLSRAADWGVDLVVMGAYGHARWTEKVLGGATRTVLTNARMPVLMSH